MEEYKIGKYNEDGTEEIFDEDRAKKNFIVSLATCTFFHSRGICLNDYCERCKFNLPNELNFKSQGEMLRHIHHAITRSARVREVLKSDYEQQPLKQGKLEEIDFSGCMNITDKFPEVKSQTIVNTGFSKLHFANLMDENTCVYLSQGAGVECVQLAGLSGRYVKINEGADIEVLIGSIDLIYKTPSQIIGDVFCLDILVVAEKRW